MLGVRAVAGEGRLVLKEQGKFSEAVDENIKTLFNIKCTAIWSGLFFHTAASSSSSSSSARIFFKENDMNL